MRSFFQRLLLPAALLGLALLFYGRMDRSLRQAALPPRTAAAVPARLQPVGTQLRAERAQAVKPAAVADRFERSPVLAVRESAPLTAKPPDIEAAMLAAPSAARSRSASIS